MNKQRNPNPHWVIQLIWFALVGWWAGQAWIAVAWFAMITVIGMPLGLMMMNNISKVIALRQPEHRLDNLRGEPRKQTNFIIRIIYFVFIGWWAGGLWIQIGFLLCVTIIGIPLGFKMFDNAASVMTLKR